MTEQYFRLLLSSSSCQYILWGQSLPFFLCSGQFSPDLAACYQLTCCCCGFGCQPATHSWWDFVVVAAAVIGWYTNMYGRRRVVCPARIVYLMYVCVLFLLVNFIRHFSKRILVLIGWRKMYKSNREEFWPTGFRFCYLWYARCIVVVRGELVMYLRRYLFRVTTPLKWEERRGEMFLYSKGSKITSPL